MANPAAALPLAAALTGPMAGRFSMAGRVVLYDGVCNLCCAGVRFVALRDPDKRVMFCSVQSAAARPYLRGAGLTRQQVLRRFVFVEYNSWSSGSTAALKIAGYMQQPWPLLKLLMAVPAPVRDAVYDVVAERRYRWFGRTRECQVPPTWMLDRFVDRDELVGGQCSGEGMADKDDDDEDGGGGKGEEGEERGGGEKGKGHKRGGGPTGC